MKLLLIVDVQNDFCPGGALAVPNGDEVIPVINELQSEFDLIAASKDWHPENSTHFDNWPPHCVKDTKGAEFHPDLQTDKIDQVFLKGIKKDEDGYSVFDAGNLDFEKYLKDKGVEEIYVTGLATEHCVKASALIAAAKGLKTYVIKKAVSGIDETEIKEAWQEMKEKGINIISKEDI